MEAMMNIFKSMGQETDLEAHPTSSNPPTKNSILFSSDTTNGNNYNNRSSSNGGGGVGEPLGRPVSILKKRSYGLETSMEMNDSKGGGGGGDNHTAHTYSTTQHPHNDGYSPHYSHHDADYDKSYSSRRRRRSIKKKLSMLFCRCQSQRQRQQNNEFNKFNSMNQNESSKSTLPNSTSNSRSISPDKNNNTNDSNSPNNNNNKVGYEVSVPTDNDTINAISPLRDTDEVGIGHRDNPYKSPKKHSNHGNNENDNNNNNSNNDTNSISQDNTNPHDLLGSNCAIPQFEWNDFVQVLNSPKIEGFKKIVFGEDDIPDPTSLDARMNSQRASGNGNGHPGVEELNVVSLLDREGSILSNNSASITGGTKKRRAFYPEPMDNDGEDTTITKETKETVECDTLKFEQYSHSGNGGDDQSASVGMNPLPFTNSTPIVPTGPRPHEEEYDADFTVRFLKEATNTGIMLVYFKNTTSNPNENDNNDENEDYDDLDDDDDELEMLPSLINLFIEPGNARGSRLLEPRLYWTELTSNTTEGKSSGEFSISLLDIYSIHTSLSESTSSTEENDQDQSTQQPPKQPQQPEENTTFFTITTNSGSVHAFEAPTQTERNYTVAGIKNVVAWLTHHLIMGSMTNGMTLMEDIEDVEGVESGELPSLRTPVQAMNEITHSFLD